MEGRVADHLWLGGNPHGWGAIPMVGGQSPWLGGDPHGWGVISFTFYGILDWELKK